MIVTTAQWGQSSEDAEEQRPGCKAILFHGSAPHRSCHWTCQNHEVHSIIATIAIYCSWGDGHLDIAKLSKYFLELGGSQARRCDVVIGHTLDNLLHVWMTWKPACQAINLLPYRSWSRISKYGVRLIAVENRQKRTEERNLIAVPTGWDWDSQVGWELCFWPNTFFPIFQHPRLIEQSNVPSWHGVWHVLTYNLWNNHNIVI